MRFRKKTTDVDAWQWQPGQLDAQDAPLWLNDAMLRYPERNSAAFWPDGNPNSMTDEWRTAPHIEVMAHSILRARPGDYLVRFEDGTIEAMPALAFEELYERDPNTLHVNDRFRVSFDLMKDQIVSEVLNQQFPHLASPNRVVRVVAIPTRPDGTKELQVSSDDERGQLLPTWPIIGGIERDGETAVPSIVLTLDHPALGLAAIAADIRVTDAELALSPADFTRRRLLPAAAMMLDHFRKQTASAAPEAPGPRLVQ